MRKTPSESGIMRELRPHAIWEFIKVGTGWIWEKWGVVMVLAVLSFAGTVLGYIKHLPWWLLTMGAVLFIVFILRVIVSLFERKVSVGIAAEPIKIGEITYAFNPATPEVLPVGWNCHYKDQGVRIEFGLPKEHPVVGCMAIFPTGRCSIFVPVQPSFSVCNRLKFYARFISTDATVYVWFEVASQDGKIEEVRIAYRAGKRDPKPFQDGSKEWVILLNGKSCGNGWREFDIFLPSDIQRTFGTKGLSFNMLTKLSFRGHIYISPVSFYES